MVGICVCVAGGGAVNVAVGSKVGGSSVGVSVAVGVGPSSCANALLGAGCRLPSTIPLQMASVNKNFLIMDLSTFFFFDLFLAVFLIKQTCICLLSLDMSGGREWTSFESPP